MSKNQIDTRKGNINNYKVYMHIVNGTHRYIGATCLPVERRWSKGLKYHGNPEFMADVKKYTWDAIEHIIVKDGLNKPDALELEQLLIEFYVTVDSTKVYNKIKNINYIDAKSKTVLQIDKTTNTVIKEWNSATEVERELGINQGKISLVCNHKGRMRSTGGYIWKFKEETTTTVTTTTTITCEQV